MPFLTGGQKPIFADDAATLASIVDAHFDPKAQVYLPLEAQTAMSAAGAGTMKISMEKLSAQEIDATVDASTNTMLVAAQSYYHDWQAYVDAKPTRLWRAQVRLVYVDWSFRAGLFISLATLIGMPVFYFSFPRLKKN
jgi:hypothetical protein